MSETPLLQRVRERESSSLIVPIAYSQLLNAFSVFLDPFQQENGSDASADSDEGTTKPSTKAGRRKIKIEFIQDKSRRHITFSKRKAGIMKKVRVSQSLSLVSFVVVIPSSPFPFFFLFRSIDLSFFCHYSSYIYYSIRLPRIPSLIGRDLPSYLGPFFLINSIYFLLLFSVIVFFGGGHHRRRPVVHSTLSPPPFRFLFYPLISLSLFLSINTPLTHTFTHTYTHPHSHTGIRAVHSHRHTSSLTRRLRNRSRVHIHNRQTTASRHTARG